MMAWVFGVLAIIFWILSAYFLGRVMKKTDEDEKPKWVDGVDSKLDGIDKKLDKLDILIDEIRGLRDDIKKRDDSKS